MIKRLLVGFGLCVLILASQNSKAQVLLSEDFSTASDSVAPAGWTNTALSGTETWIFYNPGLRTLNSPISGRTAMFDSDYNGSGSAEDAVLESPAFDASAGTILLTFDHYFESGFGGSYAVEVFNGTVWDTILEGGAASTSNPQSEALDITAMAGGSTAAKIRFHWNGDYSWYWFVDNIVVSAVNCVPPTALGATNFTATSADVYWTGGGASDWNVEYGIAGFIPGTGTAINATNDTVTVSGLSPANIYEFYVRDSCGVGNSSSWSGPYAFALNVTCASAAPISGTGLISAAGPASGGGCENCSSGASNATWYSFTAPSNGLIDISACGLSSTDTRLWVYSGSCGTLTQIASDDDACTSSDGFASEILGIPVTAGNTYYIEWDDRWNNDDFQFNFTFTVVNCTAPSALGATAITATSADAYWTGGGASDWNVEYGMSGFTQGSGTMLDVTNDTISLTGLTAGTAYDFYVRDSCAVGNVSSWVGPFTFVTAFAGPSPLVCATGSPGVIFTEEFDAINGWTGDVGTGNGNWEIPGHPTSSNTGPNSEHSGPSGSFMNYEASGTTLPDSGVIYSPAIDLSIGATDAELSFWMHAYGSEMGTLIVGVGTSLTGPFDTVFTWTGQYQTSGNDPWVNIGADLTPYIGSTIYLKFKQIDGTGYMGDMSIDLVEVSTCLGCATPSSLMASNVTATSVDLSWTTGGATDWQIEYGPAGFTPGTGTLMGISTNPYTLAGLTPNMAYDLYIRDSCGIGNVSPWSTSISFTTPCASLLNGTYTINSNMPTGGTNFASFGDLAAELNSCGISGAVTVNVAEGVYNESVIFDTVVGATASTPIVIQADPSNTLPAEIRDSSTTSADNYVIQFNGSNYITLDGIAVTGIGGTYSTAIEFMGTNENITIQNCTLTSTAITGSNSTNHTVIYDNSSASNKNTNITISGNEVVNGTYAIYMYGVTTTNLETGLNIVDNDIHDFSYYGIRTYYQDGAVISGNTITAVAAGYTTNYGIYNGYSDNSTVSGNNVYVAGTSTNYGLYNYYCDATAGAPNLVANNMFVCDGNSGTTYGMSIYNNNYTDVNFNSVLVNAGSASAGHGVYFYSSSSTSYGNVTAMNNNIVNTGGGVVVEVSTTAASSGYVTSSNYNNIYGTGTDLVTVGSTDYADLASYQAAAMGMDANSVSVDPVFSGPTDLHALGTGINAAGSPIAGITMDIDGDIRDVATPDIGADEFTPPSCSPSSGLVASELYADSILVAWVAGGGSSFTIEYGLSGFTPGTGMTITTTDTFAMITSLTPQTAYDFYIIDDCGSNGLSPAFGPYTATTACSAVSGFPSTEDFESTGSSAVPACWTDLSSNTYSWRTDEGGTTSSGTGPLVDNTTGTSSGMYLYVEATNGSTGDMAIIETPMYDLSGIAGTPQLSFYYHMNGSAITYLLVEAYNANTMSWDSVYAIVGEQQAAQADPYALAVVDLASYAGGLTSIRFTTEKGTGSFAYEGDVAIDDITIEEAPVALSCPVPAPTVSDIDLCVPGSSTTIMATAGDAIINYNSAGLISNAGTSINLNFTADTTIVVYNVAANGNGGNVGPLTSIATAGFGNFSNGQYITVMDTILIDSMTVKANGAVTAQMVISNAANTTEIQYGEEFTTGSATDDYRVPVKMVLTPGVYFMNINFISGSGQLFRATGGASYPYTLSGLMSIDSTNFSNQARIYYTFDLSVSEVCVSDGDSVAINITNWAGMDDRVFVCDDGGSVDLSMYLSNGAAAGGTFSTSTTGVITGSMFDPSVSGSGTYMVEYVIAAAAGCASDTAMFEVTVGACSNCATLVAPMAMGDSICGPGIASLSAATAATDIMWTDANGDFFAYGNSIDVNVATNTTFNAMAIQSNTASAVIGADMASLSNNVYPTGNFTNGQWINVEESLRIDSVTFAVNGALDFVVALLTADKSDTLQVSKLISFAGADTAQKEVGLYIEPGVYFIRTISVSGTGVLWRPESGASYPYAVSGLMSVDSSDFGPSRYYYLYEMVVSSACASMTDSAVAFVDMMVNAGMDNSDTICDTAGTVDLAAYLDANAMTGGMWVDTSATGALTGSTFDPSMVANGASYMFYYVVESAGACPSDTAVIDVYVKDCTVGLDEYNNANLLLYPNPTRGNVTVKNMGNASQQLHVEVYGVNGALMFNNTFVGENEVTVDLARLAKGVYTFKVTTDNEVMVQRVVKQ